MHGLSIFSELLIHAIMRKSGVSRSTKRAAKTTNCRPVNGRLKWITDCTSGFRAIRRDAWQRLNLTAQGFQIETEMIYEAVINKLVIAEVPISCNWESVIYSLYVLRDGWKTVKLLVRKLIDELEGRQTDARNQGS